MKRLSVVVLTIGVFGFMQRKAAAQPAAQTSRPATISRERLQRVLGGPRAPLRVVRSTGVSDLAPTVDSVRIVPGEFVFRKTADTARRVRSGNGPRPTPGDATVLEPSVRGIDKAATFAMPYRWWTIDSAGVEHVLAPFFILVGGGLSYDVQSRTYRGTALVGVEDTLHLGQPSTVLARPLRLQLTTTSGGTVTPAQLAIGHTSLDYDSVRIVSTDSTNVRIRTGADPIGILIRIPVRSISVALIPQQTSVQGFGLGTTSISVSLPRGLARSDSAVVTFSATKAPVHPAAVSLAGGEAANVQLRSGLPGVDSIRAFLDGVQVGETVIRFEAPWAFLGATLFGLFVGGAARFVSAKRRKRAKAFYWDVLKGAPFGFIAAAASAIGLDLLQLKIDDPGTWIAVAVTTAMGAWLGTRVVERSAQAPTQ
jgi:hypothetical protein